MMSPRNSITIRYVCCLDRKLLNLLGIMRNNQVEPGTFFD